MITPRGSFFRSQFFMVPHLRHAGSERPPLFSWKSYDPTPPPFEKEKEKTSSTPPPAEK